MKAMGITLSMRNSQAKRNARDFVIQAIANIASQMARTMPGRMEWRIRKRLIRKFLLVAMNLHQVKTGLYGPIDNSESRGSSQRPATKTQVTRTVAIRSRPSDLSQRTNSTAERTGTRSYNR